MGFNYPVARREFPKNRGAAAAAGMVLPAAGRAASGDERAIRIGCVGVGRRGMGLLGTLLSLEGVEIPAVWRHRRRRRRPSARHCRAVESC